MVGCVSVLFLFYEWVKKRQEKVFKDGVQENAIFFHILFHELREKKQTGSGIGVDSLHLKEFNFLCELFCIFIELCLQLRFLDDDTILTWIPTNKFSASSPAEKNSFNETKLLFLENE